MNKLFVATSNEGKLREIKSILKEFKMDVIIVCPKDYDDKTEPDEDGLTFKENALIKAKYYYNKYKIPTLADDSGLCIEYLNNNPGIHSSRFMNHLTYKERNEYILNLMKGVKNRNASFHCALAYIDNDIEKTYESILKGEISHEQKGEFGFGYDPIFYLKDFNKTNSELNEEEKNKVSHRYLVLKEWVKDVKDI